jgi:hypothetical protein
MSKVCSLHIMVKAKADRTDRKIRSSPWKSIKKDNASYCHGHRELEPHFSESLNKFYAGPENKQAGVNIRMR